MVTARQSGFAVYAMKTRSETMGQQQRLSYPIVCIRAHTHTSICICVYVRVWIIHVVADVAYVYMHIIMRIYARACVFCTCVNCVRNAYMYCGPIGVLRRKIRVFRATRLHYYACAKFIVRNFV